MTRAQEAAIQDIEDELRKTRHITHKPRIREYERIVYFEVADVTVTIGRAGGIELPALRS